MTQSEGEVWSTLLFIFLCLSYWVDREVGMKKNGKNQLLFKEIQFNETKNNHDEKQAGLG